MPRDLEAELRDWNGDWPPAWRPKAGDILTGRVLLYSVGTGAFGPVRTVIVQRDDGTQVSVWLSSEVLRREFETHRPRVGERIGLAYYGQHDTKKYHRWRLLVDRDGGDELQFTPLGGERGDADDGDPFAGIETPYARTKGLT